MFEEEYTNFLVNYGMLQESKMCHYRPSEMTGSVQGIVQSEMYEQVKSLKKEPVGTTAVWPRKEARRRNKDI